METRDDLLNLISDTYKSAYGMRPNLSNYSEMSNEELESEVEHLVKMSYQQYEREQQMVSDKVEEFKATIDKLMTYGADSMLTALTWLVEAEDMKLRSIMDVEGFLYRRGILCSDYGNDIKKELIKLI